MDFFSSILDFFQTLALLLGQALSNFVSLFSVLASFFTIESVIDSFVPSLLYASFGIVVAVGVVKLVLGR